MRTGGLEAVEVYIPVQPPLENFQTLGWDEAGLNATSLPPLLCSCQFFLSLLEEKSAQALRLHLSAMFAGLQGVQMRARTAAQPSGPMCC